MKKISFLAVSLLIVIAVLPVKVLAENMDGKIVFVKNGQIFALTEHGERIRQLTEEGASKYLPVWSKDGSRIAFLSAGVKDQMRGHLIVIDEDGNTLHDMPYQGRMDSAGGMRFIESLEWIGSDRIALSGSVNPSLTATIVIDLTKQTDYGGIFDDGPGADFSPDGRHFAYSTGSPHFTPESMREPTLNVDFAEVFPELGAHINFVSRRAWAPDSGSLAVIIEDPLTKRRRVLVWSLDGSESKISAPLPLGEIADLFWRDSDLIINSSQGSLRVSTKTLSLESISSREVANPDRAVLPERLRLLDLVEGYGGREPDFWCGQCALAALPRKVSVED